MALVLTSARSSVSGHDRPAQRHWADTREVGADRKRAQSRLAYTFASRGRHTREKSAHCDSFSPRLSWRQCTMRVPTQGSFLRMRYLVTFSKTRVLETRRVIPTTFLSSPTTSRSGSSFIINVLEYSYGEMSELQASRENHRATCGISGGGLSFCPTGCMSGRSQRLSW